MYWQCTTLLVLLSIKSFLASLQSDSSSSYNGIFGTLRLSFRLRHHTKGVQALRQTYSSLPLNFFVPKAMYSLASFAALCSLLFSCALAQDTSFDEVKKAFSEYNVCVQVTGAKQCFSA